jgi:PAS domain S-box-containing protein
LSLGRVFIVDDRPDEIRLLGELLRANGYDVQLATTGHRALDAIPDAAPELVIVDLELPDVDGLTLCRLLRSAPATAELPIICMSEAGESEVRIRSFEQGAVDFVQKPLEPAEVLARVKRHVTVARVRAALQESEAKFRSVTESAIDAIISADAEGVIRSWNRAAEAIFGYPAGEAVGQKLELIIPERFREAHAKGLRRVALGGEGRIIGSTVELAALRRDGREIPIELSLASWKLGESRYFTGIIRDISERKGSEERFRSVTESAIDAIVTADRGGVIRSWNRAAERIFGHRPEEAVGESLELIIPERFREAHRTGLARVSGGGEGRVIGRTVEVAGQRRDGSEIPIELSLSSWTHEGHRYFTGIIRDISERKAAEAQLKAYAEELGLKHDELRAQHEQLKRQQEALLAFHRQNDRLFQAVASAMPGSQLDGKYRLGATIARGGFGVVFEGVQLALDRPVAIKVFQPPAQAEEREALERFRREGLTACRVAHPNAVAVIDSGISEAGLPYLVMEKLHGRTVAGHLKEEGSFGPRRAALVAADVCSVLAVAHASGIVHRDVKPSNVFLHRPPGSAARSEEVVKVLDFGIARLVDTDDALDPITKTGQLIGTPVYMAPERFRGEAESGQADVYSLGMMLYEMLTGQAAFAAEASPWMTLWRQMHTVPTPLHERHPSVPRDLSDLVQRTLATRPEERPRAAELEKALREMAKTLPPDAPSAPAPLGSRSPGHLTLGTSVDQPWYADPEAPTLDQPAAEDDEG